MGRVFQYWAGIPDDMDYLKCLVFPDILVTRYPMIFNIESGRVGYWVPVGPWMPVLRLTWMPMHNVHFGYYDGPVVKS